MEASIVIPLHVARAVVSKLNPHFLLSTQEKDFWSTPGMDPSYPIERIVQFQERISATPGELETLVSINPDKVEGGKFQVELYVLSPSGNWYSSADSAPYRNGGLGNP